MQALLLLQDSSLSVWLRESDYAVFALLIAHTIALGFVAGLAIAQALRVLRRESTSQSLYAAFTKLFRYALVAAIASGVLLVVSYPAKALTNPLFYLKLLLLLLALAISRLVMHSAAHGDDTPGKARIFAVIAAALWISTLVAGKFLAYTNTVLLLY